MMKEEKPVEEKKDAARQLDELGMSMIANLVRTHDRDLADVGAAEIMLRGQTAVSFSQSVWQRALARVLWDSLEATGKHGAFECVAITARDRIYVRPIMLAASVEPAAPLDPEGPVGPVDE